jgi:serine/threonine protein kinase
MEMADLSLAQLLDVVLAASAHDGQLPAVATWAAVRSIIRQASRGLHACHAAGIVHRDLKPDNILLNIDGAVRLCDFGSAYTSCVPQGGNVPQTAVRLLRAAGDPLVVAEAPQTEEFTIPDDTCGLAACVFGAAVFGGEDEFDTSALSLLSSIADLPLWQRPDGMGDVPGAKVRASAARKVVRCLPPPGYDSEGGMADPEPLQLSSGAFRSTHPCVTTYWYRAPELMFAAPLCCPAVDMWALGCITAECFLALAPPDQLQAAQAAARTSRLMPRQRAAECIPKVKPRALLPGASDLDMLSRMLALLGAVQVQQWPQVACFPGFMPMKPTAAPAGVASALPSSTPTEAVEVVRQLLQYAPGSRPAAGAVCGLPWLCATSDQVASDEVALASLVQWAVKVLPRLTKHVQLEDIGLRGADGGSSVVWSDSDSDGDGDGGIVSALRFDDCSDEEAGGAAAGLARQLPMPASMPSGSPPSSTLRNAVQAATPVHSPPGECRGALMATDMTARHGGGERQGGSGGTPIPMNSLGELGSHSVTPLGGAKRQRSPPHLTLVS